jgi:hypothetical protein
MTGSMASRKVKLPEANKMARMLRTGRTLDDLTVRYGINSNVITQRLIANGWNPETGAWVGDSKSAQQAGAPLSARGDGAGQTRHHVGGGDNPNVVSTVSRPIRQRREYTFVWPVSETKPAPVVVAPRPRRITDPWSSPHTNRKVTPEQGNAMATRYLDGESSVELGRAFGVNERTVRKYLVALGVPLRTRSEALQLSHDQRRRPVTLVAPILSEAPTAEVA